MNVVLVSDSKIVRDAFKTLLSEYLDIDVTATDDSIEAFRAAQTNETDFLILDINGTNGNGLKLLEQINMNNIGGKVIALINQSNTIYRILAKHLGADYIFDKYMEYEKVIDLIAAGLPVAIPVECHI